MAAHDTAKLALITGGARRLGAAMARRLHRIGFAVAVHARNSVAEAEALCGELNQGRDDSARVFVSDFGAAGAEAALIAGVLEWRGRLDVLVNNASSFYPTPLAELTPADWDALVGSNLRIPLFLTRAALEPLQQSQGLVVNMIDAMVERGIARFSAYAAAKGGLATLTRSLALELAPQVRVNGIAPGAILWPEHGDTEEQRRRVLESIPLARAGQPEDIAAALQYLVEAGYVTGEILTVDGGRRLKSTT